MQRRLLYLIACLHVCLLFYGQNDSSLSDSTWFEEYFTRASYERELGNYSSIDSLEIVRQLAEKKNFIPAICHYHIEKAAAYVASNQSELAILEFKTAIDLADKHKLYNLGANARMGLANLYEFNGNTLEAARIYPEVTRLLKSQNRKRTLIGLYSNMEKILFRLQQKNNTLENMLSAVVTSKMRESDLVKIINTNNAEEPELHFADGTMVKEVGTHIIYVILGDAKFKIRDFKTQSTYGANRDIQRIPSGTLSSIPDFPRSGSLLRELTLDPKVYLAKENILYQINSPEVLDNYGSWDAVYYVPDSSLVKFPKSDTLVTLENMNVLFNLKQDFDNLSDSITIELAKNERLSSELSERVAIRNQALQKRNTLLWVSGIGLAALLLIVFLLVRNFRQKQAEEKLQRKMAVEKERTRIATDMHDDLGAGLSRIKFLSETIGLKKQNSGAIDEDIIKIKEYSHEMIDKMGEIVWALNEKNDSLSDLLSYTRAYAVDYLSQNHIHCRVSIPEQLNEHFLSGEFRRNIYLSVKEALHNIVKHARAKEVKIVVEAGESLNIKIADDGIGFTGNNKPFRNGLNNMKGRMEYIGGEFRIMNGNGTTIILTAPL